jgi:hypothetical protein
MRQRLPQGLMALEGVLKIGTSIAAFVLISGDRPQGILDGPPRLQTTSSS